MNDSNEHAYLERLPRVNIMPPKTVDIIINPPPEQPLAEGSNVLPLIMQCLVAILNFSLVSFVISKDISTSLLCALIGAFGSLLTGLISFLMKRKKQNKINTQLKKDYNSYLSRIEQQIITYRKKYDDYYSHNLPTINDRINNVNNLIPSIWDRCVQDHDFLTVLLGHKRNCREFNVLCNEKIFGNKYPEKTTNLLELGFAKTVPVIYDLKGKSLGLFGDNSNKILIDIVSDLVYHHNVIIL